MRGCKADTYAEAVRLSWRTRFDEPKCFSAAFEEGNGAVLSRFDFGGVFLGRELKHRTRDDSARRVVGVC